MKKYSGTVGTVTGKARSITLEDINRVVGFNESNLNFNNYIFTTDIDADFSENKINYYYPSFLGEERTDKPYFAKAGETLKNQTVPEKSFICNQYAYFENENNGYSVYWKGTDKSWSDEVTTLKNAKYMPLIVGRNADYNYGIASHSIRIDEGSVQFMLWNVVDGGINGNSWCVSCWSEDVDNRPRRRNRNIYSTIDYITICCKTRKKSSI